MSSICNQRRNLRERSKLFFSYRIHRVSQLKKLLLAVIQNGKSLFKNSQKFSILAMLNLVLRIIVIHRENLFNIHIRDPVYEDFPITFVKEYVSIPRYLNLLLGIIQMFNLSITKYQLVG